MQQVIILGAGKSKQFVENPTNIKVNLQETVLDWQVSAFEGESSRLTFVGGYQFDKIAHKYPDLHFVFNSQWDKQLVMYLCKIQDLWKIYRHLLLMEMFCSDLS